MGPAERKARGHAYRRRRFHLFVRLVDGVLARRETCRILDVGGDPDYWTTLADLLGERRYHVTLVNRTAYEVDETRFSSMAGDARDLGAFADMRFDIVHSNSVIEHVGRFGDMQAMAREVRRLAPSYFVQTPYFWFPIEPHCATAFFHWMPEPIQVSMLMRRPRGDWGQAPNIATALRQIRSVALLDRRTLATLFPDAAIRRERILGLTKSLIAIRDLTGRPVPTARERRAPSGDRPSV